MKVNVSKTQLARMRQAEGNAPATKSESERASLYLLLTIVNEGQAGSISKIIRSAGGSIVFACHGQGTAPSDLLDVFGLTHSQKQIVIAPIRGDMYPSIKKGIAERFAISRQSKGVSALFKFSAMVGKNAYRLLSDDRVGIDAKGANELMERTPMDNKFELVVAIVNDSYTDLVMDAAKAAGARGGTVLNAKGTGNKEIESFFGIVITPEKQIVLILVPKEIRDQVLSSIYKNVGLGTKGQGIVFSLPTTDVLGISMGETPVTPEASASDATQEGN